MFRDAHLCSWLNRAISLCLIACTVAAPQLQASAGSSTSAHCRVHDDAAMAGMSAAAPAITSPTRTDVVAGDECSHCPPSDCTTTVTCNGFTIAAAVRSEPITWRTASNALRSIRSSERFAPSPGLPPPTPPPQA